MIKIRFISPTLSIFLTYVRIYDELGNLVSNGVSCNNIYMFEGNGSSTYKIIAVSRLGEVITSFIPASNICIYFNNNSFTFYLTDKNYPGLRVEKGEISLGL